MSYQTEFIIINGCDIFQQNRKRANSYGWCTEGPDLNLFVSEKSSANDIKRNDKYFQVKTTQAWPKYNLHLLKR